MESSIESPSKQNNLILVDSEEKKKLEEQIEILEKEYLLLQKMLFNEECKSGLCYDGLVDYYYEKYYIDIKEFKNALDNGFKLNIKLPTKEELELENMNQQAEITEYAIKLGRYL